jgi:hypothetical protein
LRWLKGWADNVPKQHRYWVSWYAPMTPENLQDNKPFQFWITGNIVLPDEVGLGTFCAVIDAGSEAEVWGAIAQHFPQMQHRYISNVPNDWQPAETRFTNWQGRTATSEEHHPSV